MQRTIQSLRQDQNRRTRDDRYALRGSSLHEMHNTDHRPVRLTSGALAVFSPVALTPEVQSKLQSMGNEIKYITALDYEHHIFLGPWHEAFPNAHIIGMEGLAEKRAKDSEMKSVPFHTVFSDTNKLSTKISEEFDMDFEYEYVHSHTNKELVFHYKPDKTLIEADLLFNLPATEQYSRTGEPANKGLATRMFAALQNTQGSSQQRMIWYGMAKDKKAMSESLRRINAWNFERIIPCHGDVIEDDAKGVFRRVFGWFLEGQNSKVGL